MSTQQRVQCFIASLPEFKKAYENYLTNRKHGKRPIKNKGGNKCN